MPSPHACHFANVLYKWQRVASSPQKAAVHHGRVTRDFGPDARATGQTLCRGSIMGRPLGFEEPIRVGSHILIRSNLVNLKAHNTLFYTTTHSNLVHPIATQPPRLSRGNRGLTFLVPWEQRIDASSVEVTEDLRFQCRERSKAASRTKKAKVPHDC